MKNKLCYALCLFLSFSTITNSQESVFSFEYIKGRRRCDLSVDFLKKINASFNIDHFIETGTYKGWTTEAAAKIFNAVHSIELDSKLYQDAIKKLKQYNNVFLYQGDSKKILPALCKRLKGTLLFWLDGHFSGGDTAKGEESTPLVFELKAIKESGIKNPLILVDDIRGMRYRCKNKISGWPDYPFIEEIVFAIKSINKQYTIITMGDVLFAYVPHGNVKHSPVTEATFISRLYNNDKRITLHNVLEAEKLIANASDKEKECIIFHKSYLKEFYYNLWDGIIKLNQKKYIEAQDCFSRLLSEGYDDDRIHVYLEAAKAQGSN